MRCLLMMFSFKLYFCSCISYNLIVREYLQWFERGLRKRKVLSLFIVLLIVIPTVLSVISYSQTVNARQRIKVLSSQETSLSSSLNSAQKAYIALKNQDQY